MLAKVPVWVTMGVWAAPWDRIALKPLTTMPESSPRKMGGRGSLTTPTTRPRGSLVDSADHLSSSGASTCGQSAGTERGQRVAAGLWSSARGHDVSESQGPRRRKHCSWERSRAGTAASLTHGRGSKCCSVSWKCQQVPNTMGTGAQSTAPGGWPSQWEQSPLQAGGHQGPPGDLPLIAGLVPHCSQICPGLARGAWASIGPPEFMFTGDWSSGSDHTPSPSQGV